MKDVDVITIEKWVDELFEELVTDEPLNHTDLQNILKITKERLMVCNAGVT